MIVIERVVLEICLFDWVLVVVWNYLVYMEIGLFICVFVWVSDCYVLMILC